MSLIRRFVLRAVFGCLVASCGGAEGEPCGPTRAIVRRVVDGDTLVLEDGERVRYLLVDAPELDACFGEEASAWNAAVVEGRLIDLAYDDAVCRDDYGRLLATVTVDGVDVGASLVERGFACVLYIPPAGADRKDALLALEAEARARGRGLFGACARRRCTSMGSVRSRAGERWVGARGRSRSGVAAATGTLREGLPRGPALRSAGAAWTPRRARRGWAPPR